MYRNMVYMGGKGKNNASRTNQTSHFGIMGGLAPSTNIAQGVKRFRLRRARNRQTIPLMPGPGLAFMREHGILSVNPAGSGGIGLTKVLVDRSMGPCNCGGGPHPDPGSAINVFPIPPTPPTPTPELRVLVNWSWLEVVDTIQADPRPSYRTWAFDSSPATSPLRLYVDGDELYLPFYHIGVEEWSPTYTLGWDVAVGGVAPQFESSGKTWVLRRVWIFAQKKDGKVPKVIVYFENDEDPGEHLEYGLKPGYVDAFVPAVPGLDIAPPNLVALEL